MPRTPQQNKEFRQALEEDFTKAQQQAEKSEGAIGIPGTDRRTRRDPSSFAAKGIRYKGQLLGQKELADSETAINKTIEDLVKRSNFANRQEEFKFRQDLRTKFNKTRNLILKAGLKFDSQIEAQRLDFENRVAMVGAFTKAVGGVGELAGRQGAFKKSPDTYDDQMTYGSHGSAGAGNRQSTTKFGGYA